MINLLRCRFSTGSSSIKSSASPTPNPFHRYATPTVSTCKRELEIAAIKENTIKMLQKLPKLASDFNIISIVFYRYSQTRHASRCAIISNVTSYVTQTKVKINGTNFQRLGKILCKKIGPQYQIPRPHFLPEYFSEALKVCASFCNVSFLFILLVQTALRTVHITGAWCERSFMLLTRLRHAALFTEATDEASDWFHVDHFAVTVQLNEL